jgi:hypothetical protein
MGIEVTNCIRTMRLKVKSEGARLAQRCGGGGQSSLELAGEPGGETLPRLDTFQGFAVEARGEVIALVGEGVSCVRTRSARGGALEIRLPVEAKRLHRTAARRRRNALHQFSRRMVDRYQTIVVGDVSAPQLAKTRMAKSVLDDTPRKRAAAAEPSRAPQVWTCLL